MRKPTQHELYLASQNGGKLPESYTGESESTDKVKKPNSTSTKAELQAWLDQEGVEYDDGATNDELYELVKQEAG